MTTIDWDDDRLATAFSARTAHQAPTPSDLVSHVLDTIGQRRSPRRTRAAWIAAAAGLAALVIVAIAVGTTRPVERGPLAVTSPAANPSQPRPASPSSPVTDPLGEPISVTAAIAVRDGHDANDRELVVAGFLSPWFAIPCPADFGLQNPTRLACPESFQYVMERPEQLRTSSGNTIRFGPPDGPSIQPSFALVTRPDVPASQAGESEGIPVVLIGHFHDRRAALCKRAETDACAKTFVVDRVAVVDGVQQAPTTIQLLERWDEASKTFVTETPKDLAEDVDRLVRGVAPGAQIESRLLVTIDRVIGLEPVLKDDEVVPAIGNPGTLMWLVTAVDLRDGVARPRTFALIDGSNWFAEVTATGALTLERRASGGGSPSGPVVASSDPTAFAAAPATVLGIEVRDIATVMRDRRADFGDLGRDEMAVRAWYVGPNPAAACEPAAAAVHPPTPPCDDARHWLVDRPEQLGTEEGQLRTKPEHWPPVLNPLLPIDVPFDVPATWAGDVAVPQAVIVLGHFEDTRVDTYAANLYFVIDALAWTPDRTLGSIDSLTRLTTSATEDQAAVIARIDEVSPNPAVATWATVVDAAEFGALEPETARDAPEFTSGAPVWIVRRLIPDEMDGRQRFAVESAYTADHGTRVWWTETPDSSPDLGTTFDLHDPDPRTAEVRVFDYDQLLTGARAAREGDTFAWQPVAPDVIAGMAVARGASAREVAVRWTAGTCQQHWRLRVNTVTQPSPGTFVQPQTYDDDCPGTNVRRVVVLVFGHPVNPRDIRALSLSDASGG